MRKEFFKIGSLVKTGFALSAIFIGVMIGTWSWQKQFLTKAPNEEALTHSPRYEIEFENGDLQRRLCIEQEKKLHSYSRSEKSERHIPIERAMAILSQKKSFQAVDTYFKGEHE